MATPIDLSGAQGVPRPREPLGEVLRSSSAFPRTPRAAFSPDGNRPRLLRPVSSWAGSHLFEELLQRVARDGPTVAGRRAGVVDGGDVLVQMLAGRPPVDLPGSAASQVGRGAGGLDHRGGHAPQADADIVEAPVSPARQTREAD